MVFDYSIELDRTKGKIAKELGLENNLGEYIVGSAFSEVLLLVFNLPNEDVKKYFSHLLSSKTQIRHVPVTLNDHYYVIDKPSSRERLDSIVDEVQPSGYFYPIKIFPHNPQHAGYQASYNTGLTELIRYMQQKMREPRLLEK